MLLDSLGYSFGIFYDKTILGKLFCEPINRTLFWSDVFHTMNRTLSHFQRDGVILGDFSLDQKDASSSE